MTSTPVQHDGRTGPVERTGYRRAYVLVSFGLLLSVVSRSFALGQPAWDLLALVVLGGVVVVAEQRREGAPLGRSVLPWLLTAVIALVLAATLVAMGGSRAPVP